MVSQETAISRSLQQTLASVYNGVIVWRLIMGWIPGYGSLCDERMDPYHLQSPNLDTVVNDNKCLLTGA
jgi:hypothetical protein